MARIAGINIPPHQHAEIGLTAIFGIGRTRARKIYESAGIELSKNVKDLTDAELERIRAHDGVSIGRASCRDRVCQYGEISGVTGSLKKKKLIVYEVSQKQKAKTYK